jgi:hypothetical protein
MGYLPVVGMCGPGFSMAFPVPQVPGFRLAGKNFFCG